MARFSLKKPIRLVVRGASTAVIPNPQGIPVAVNTPSLVVELKAGIVDIKDQEVIDRIRKDGQYNIPEGIVEISEEEIEAIDIKKKKMREAEVEIEEKKKARKK